MEKMATFAASSKSSPTGPASSASVTSKPCITSPFSSGQPVNRTVQKISPQPCGLLPRFRQTRPRPSPQRQNQPKRASQFTRTFRLQNSLLRPPRLQQRPPLFLRNPFQRMLCRKLNPKDRRQPKLPFPDLHSRNHLHSRALPLRPPLQRQMTYKSPLKSLRQRSLRKTPVFPKAPTNSRYYRRPNRRAACFSAISRSSSRKNLLALALVRPFRSA